MSWYLWVFGTVAVLNMGAVALVVLALGTEEYKERRRRREGGTYELQILRENHAELQARHRRLSEQFSEVIKKNNQWGRVSP